MLVPQGILRKCAPMPGESDTQTAGASRGEDHARLRSVPEEVQFFKPHPRRSHYRLIVKIEKSLMQWIFLPCDSPLLQWSSNTNVFVPWCFPSAPPWVHGNGLKVLGLYLFVVPSRSGRCWLRYAPRCFPWSSSRPSSPSLSSHVFVLLARSDEALCIYAAAAAVTFPHALFPCPVLALCQPPNDDDTNPAKPDHATWSPSSLKTPLVCAPNSPSHFRLSIDSSRVEVHHRRRATRLTKRMVLLQPTSRRDAIRSDVPFAGKQDAWEESAAV